MNVYYTKKDESKDSRYLSDPVKTMLSNALSGGFESITYPGYATGLIKYIKDVPNLKAVNASEVSARLSYIARILNTSFISATPAALIHLNSYKKVEAFNDYSDLEVETLINYGFPAIYCSYSNGNSALSECAEDIILDRLRAGSVYNRGIKFELDPSQPDMFFVDRKAATLFRTQHLKDILKKDQFSPIRIHSSAIRSRANELEALIHKLSKTRDAHIFGERIMDYTRSRSFSTINSALFDLTHYWLSIYTKSVVKSNNIMQNIDPRLRQHWTMRGFGLGSSAHLADVLESYGLRYQDYMNFLQARFLEELMQYIGPLSIQNLEDLALDNLFYEKIHDLETSVGLDPTRERLEVRPDIPSELKSTVTYDEENKTVYFSKALPSPYAQYAKRHIYIMNHLYKLAHVHVKESIGSEIMRIIKLNKLGTVATTFQSDNRGEYFLLANREVSNLKAHRVHVSIDGQKRLSIVEIDKVDVSLAIKTYASFDPTLNYFLPESNFLSLKDTRANRFLQIYRNKLSYLQEIFKIYYQQRVRSSKRQIIIALPFFKERQVLIENIKSLIESHSREYDIHILLISNLDRSNFDTVISSIEVETELLRKNADNVFIYPINTYEIDAVNLWMSNKTIAFMLGIEFANYLKDESLDIDRFYMMESDIFNAKHWWSVLAGERLTPNDAIFLGFSVYAKDETTQSLSAAEIDIKENIFYELFEKPLMKVFHGDTTGAITGSSYCFGMDAVKKLRFSIGRMSGIQTIEWHILHTINILNIRSVQVEKKIHYVSSVIDDRFGHRISGLIEGLITSYDDMLLSSNTREPMITFGISSTMNFNTQEKEEYLRAIVQANKVSEYFHGIYTEVLGEKEYEYLIQKIKNRQITYYDWVKVLLTFFAACIDKPKNIIIELLNSLQPLSVWVFGCLADADDIKVGHEDIRRILSEKKIIKFNKSKFTNNIQELSTVGGGRHIVISDIHGEYFLLKKLLTELDLFENKIIDTTEGSSLIMNGDLIDCYSNPSSDEQIWLTEDLLSDSSISVGHVKDTLGAIGQKPDDITKIDSEIRTALFNAYKSYRVLSLIWLSTAMSPSENQKSGRIVTILGNHEIDLLNGGLRYKSLQKNFLLNMLGIGGSHILERSDEKRGHKPKFVRGDIARYVKDPTPFVQNNALLKWLSMQPLGVQVGDLLVMHSGPTGDLIDKIDRGEVNNKFEVDELLTEYRDELLTKDILYTKESIVDFKRNTTFLLRDPHKLKPFLAMYSSKYLAVGHSPYLHLQNMNLDINKDSIKKHNEMINSIGSVNQKVFKVDSGVKLGNNSPQALIVQSSIIASYKLSSGLTRVFDMRNDEELDGRFLSLTEDIKAITERVKI